MGHPGRHGRHVDGLGFGNPRRDGGRGNQIRSDLGEDAALEVRGASHGVPGNRDLREASEGEGEVEGRLHLGDDAGGEDDASVGCH